MTVGFIQNSPKFGEKAENFSQVKGLAQGIKADLLVLPELFATGYTFTSKDEVISLADTPQGATPDFLKQLSIETGAVIVGGFIEREEDKVYNSSIIIYKD